MAIEFTLSSVIVVPLLLLLARPDVFREGHCHLVPIALQLLAVLVALGRAVRNFFAWTEPTVRQAMAGREAESGG